VHALTLTVVAIWSFLVALVGGLLGLVLGNIRLPVFLALGSSPAAAAGANIAVSGVAAATAAVRHVRAGRIDWRVVAWMLGPSIAGAIAGGYAATLLPGPALRIVIGGALVLFGLDLLRRRQAPRPAPHDRPNLCAAALVGAVVGLIGGLIGLILSTLRVPGLLRYARQDAVRVIGTNLVVGIAVGAAGLLGHVPGGIDWDLLLVGGSASVPGALIGSRYTGRLTTDTLLRAIAVILLLSGGVTIARGVL
jgi:uncharacterized membrane protein YfcA